MPTTMASQSWLKTIAPAAGRSIPAAQPPRATAAKVTTPRTKARARRFSFGRVARTSGMPNRW